MMLKIRLTFFLFLLSGNVAIARYEGYWLLLRNPQRANKDKNITTCDQISRSTVKSTEVKHRWIIEHFNEQESLQTCKFMPMQSAEFASPDKRHKFQIFLRSREANGNAGMQNQLQAQKAITLHSFSHSDPLFCKVRIDIAYANGAHMNKLFEKVVHQEKLRAVSEIAEVTLPQNLDSYIVNDALTIICTVVIYDEISTACDSESPADNENDEAFVSSFEKFLKAKTATDMDVIASDCVTTAHRSILLARCPLMMSLIEKEKDRYVLEATQFSCQAMECVISYIYTDKCTITPDIAEEVLRAAQNYEMPKLARNAENELVLYLDEENIASRIKLAKAVGSTVLSRGISNYIIKNRHVLSSDDWEKIETEDSSAAAFILKEAVLHLVGKTMMPKIVSTIILILAIGNSALVRSKVLHQLDDTERANKDKNISTCDEISRSTIKYTVVKHQWIIENFIEQESLQKLKTMPMQSAEFVSPDKRHKFKISLQSKETTGKTGSQTPQQAQRTLTLHSLSRSDPLSCKVRFDIAYAHESQRSSQNLAEKVIHLKKPRAVGEIAEVTLPQNMNSLIDNDALTLICVVTIYEEISTVCDEASSPGNENDKAFVSSFEKFLKAKTATDMDIIASDCVITAHRSKFFARGPLMVSLIEKEKDRYVLNATEFSCQAMQCVISFIYMDNCTIKLDIAEEVLRAAHDYNMPKLKRIAEKELVRSLDENNIDSRMKLAKDTGSTVLSRGISTYITNNRQVRSSDVSKNMETENASADAPISKETILHL
ncbi:BTB domain containing protein [Trichuris trichiura]|uniref:BTB domain containing protein n=1 Tax=Trichuris trichiura TaxID=36087 RepID=A0A077YX19_TRITR|nr:BTB domain containing protein [Trichuris trichiura]